MNEPEYYDSLRSSNAVRSLILEQKIHAALAVYESAKLKCPFYYVDAATTKTRELDLLAEYHFDSGVQGGTFALNFLVECKDLKGTHLIFSKVEEEGPFRWAGDQIFSEHDHLFQQDFLNDFAALTVGYPTESLRKKLDRIRYR